MDCFKWLLGSRRPNAPTLLGAIRLPQADGEEIPKSSGDESEPNKIDPSRLPLEERERYYMEARARIFREGTKVPEAEVAPNPTEEPAAPEEQEIARPTLLQAAQDGRLQKVLSKQDEDQDFDTLRREAAKTLLLQVSSPTEAIDAFWESRANLTDAEVKDSARITFEDTAESWGEPSKMEVSGSPTTLSPTVASVSLSPVQQRRGREVEELEKRLASAAAEAQTREEKSKEALLEKEAAGRQAKADFDAKVKELELTISEQARRLEHLEQDKISLETRQAELLREAEEKYHRNTQKVEGLEKHLVLAQQVFETLKDRLAKSEARANYYEESLQSLGAFAILAEDLQWQITGSSQPRVASEALTTVIFQASAEDLEQLLERCAECGEIVRHIFVEASCSCFVEFQEAKAAEDAASKLSGLRGSSVNFRYRTLQLEVAAKKKGEEAATTIQRIWRGHRLRCQMFQRVERPHIAGTENPPARVCGPAEQTMQERQAAAWAFVRQVFSGQHNVH